MYLRGHGGVELPRMKEPALLRPIEHMELPEMLRFSLISPNFGTLVCQVKNGQRVKKYDVILTAKETGFAIYAPATGRITIEDEYLSLCPTKIQSAFEETPHPVGRSDLAATAKLMGIIDEIDGVPLYQKLIGPVGRLFIDAYDEGIYHCAASRLLAERTEDIKEILEWLSEAMGAYESTVLVDEHSYGRIREQLDGQTFYKKIHGKYPILPQIEQKLAKNRRYIRVGLFAALSLLDAVKKSVPQTTCVVTVAGDCVGNPACVEVPVGTPVGDVLRYAGLIGNPEYVIINDMVKGHDIKNAGVPIIGGDVSVLALSKIRQPKTVKCNGCGACINACPRGIFPFHIIESFKRGNMEDVKNHHPEKCDRCGCCSMICPANVEPSRQVAEIKDKMGGGVNP